MTILRWRARAAICATAAGIIAASGCGSTGSHETPAPAGVHETATPALFSVPPNQREHLKIAEARKVAWSFAAHATGTVDWDADQTTPVISQVNGPISRILAHPGSSVKAGEALLYVSSPDISNAISLYKKGRIRRDLAKRTLERNKDLLRHDAIARKDVESSEADYQDAVTDVANDLEALQIFGVTEADIERSERQGVPINPRLAVRAPIAGQVVQQLVMPGQLVQAGTTTCFLISDVSSVWVQGHVFDKDLGSVRIGDPVEVSVPSSGKVFHGKVSYIGAIVDPATRTVPVRILTKNPRGELKKDMFVDVVIRTRNRREVLAVPLSAVLHDAQNEPFVYVEVKPGEFARRLIRQGAVRGDGVEVLSGCQEGERVVAEGSVFLQFANKNQ